MIDASIVVKWFSASGESNVNQAVDLLEHQVTGDISLVVPELVYYEVANALVHKKVLSDEMVSRAMKDLLSLGLNSYATDAGIMINACMIARKFKITVYDACYIALAQQSGHPLVTANPRHQMQIADCQIIPIEQWQ